MTRLFGILGHPISHSLSPAMHTAALRALRVDAYYTPFDVPPRFLRSVLRALSLAGVEGLNVTVPLKERVIPFLDGVDATAKAIGAVNTIVIRNRRLVGHNTDGLGIRRALEELGWHPQRAGQTVLLGAGGAARAVAWEVTRTHGSSLLIANRHVARARRLAQWLRRQRPKVRVRAVTLGAVTLHDADLVINATTVGMHRTDAPLINPSKLRPGMIVYDLIYHHDTRLIHAARRRGCVAANGRSMLLYQGAESLRLWLRREPPIEAMRRALQSALQPTAKQTRIGSTH